MHTLNHTSRTHSVMKDHTHTVCSYYSTTGFHFKHRWALKDTRDDSTKFGNLNVWKFGISPRPQWLGGTKWAHVLPLYWQGENSWPMRTEDSGFPECSMSYAVVNKRETWNIWKKKISMTLTYRIYCFSYCICNILRITSPIYQCQRNVNKVRWWRYLINN